MSNLKLTDEPDLYDIVAKIIKHPNVKVKKVAVRFVEKNLSLCPSLHNISTFSLFLECLKSQEISIGIPSINILSELLSECLKDDPSVKHQLIAALKGCDETIALRIYNVAINVARKAPENLCKMEFLLEICIKDLGKNDVLVEMNILEVLKDLCLENYGLVYLENKGVFENLVKKIEKIDEDPLAAILIPGKKGLRTFKITMVAQLGTALSQ
jgi:hypothetical protein